jgi:hypothetical protein
MLDDPVQYQPYARRVLSLTADTTETYSAKVGTGLRACRTAARSAGDRPIRSTSTSAASATVCWGRHPGFWHS